MIFNVAFLVGVVMFIHYGWTALRHDVKRTTCVLMANIYIIMIAIVLWLRSAYLRDLEGLCWALLLAAFSQGCVHIYMWFYGLSFKKAALKISQMHIPFKDFWKQIKKCL
jgi:drug/metabolite transporter (DMT)-like permease